LAAGGAKKGFGRSARGHAQRDEERKTVALRYEEQRDAVIGFSFRGRLLTVVHIEVAYDYIRIISARRASSAQEAIYAE